MALDLDKYQAEFWRTVKVGQTVVLSDEQAIEDALKAGKGKTEMDYLVKSIRVIEDRKTGIEWRFLRLESPDNLWILIKIVDREFDLRAYFEPSDFQPGDRQDLLDHECYWMFDEPADPNNYRLNDLQFARSFEIEGCVYEQKPFGMLAGFVRETPVVKELEGVLTCVCEYRTEGETKNPEAIFIEMGGEHSERGGYIYVLLGNPISQEDIEVI